jgi:hypothetical protein
MAKKKRRPRNRTSPAGAPTPNGAPAKGSASVRRDRKEQARAAKEAARKREVRTAALRRAAVFGAIGFGVFGILWFIQRAPGPGKVPGAAVTAATTAGCSDIQTPVADAPGGDHLDPGQTTTYDQHPATSGIHAQSPLPTSPAVHTDPLDETQAVHFLEHAGVILYYRADGPQALPDATVQQLTQVAETQRNTLVAPYPQLSEGTALAMTAWNKLQTCPVAVTADQAVTIANGFIEAFVCTSNAPEPTKSDDC